MAFTYDKYKESDAVRRAREEAEDRKQYRESANVIDARERMNYQSNNRPQPWSGGTYGNTLKGILDQINNREKFTYDLNGDALYQQYKQQYMNQGKLAMVDTIGQASAMTGGYGSSYAETVGNQAYQGYLQKLNDVVPQLYQMAYDKYNNEGQDLYNRYNATQSAYNTEYGEYRDTVGDWQTEMDRLTNAYYNEANMDWSKFSADRDYYTDRYNQERNFDYGQYSDAFSRDFGIYQQGVSEDQFARQMALEEAKFEWQKEQAKKTGGGSGSKKTTTPKVDNAKNDKLATDAASNILNSFNQMMNVHGLPKDSTATKEIQKLYNAAVKGKSSDFRTDVYNKIREYYPISK